MSQQEIMPEPQSNESKQANAGQPSHEEDIYAAQPYYWSTQPKEEPASGHDDSLTQNDYASGYQPQNETVYSYPENSNNSSAKATADFSQSQGQQQQRQQQQFQSQQARSPYAPDGDSFETGYNPYNSYNSYNADNGSRMQQSVPPWAHPQRSRGSFRWFWLVLLAFMFISPLFRLIGAAFFFLFPLLFIGLIVFASVVFWSTIGSRRPRGPGGHGGYNGWRGPWGW
ncbi:MAG TPA: hypothetical protein VNG51_20345 [Ktedonobacteraceae bacterium]|nr:hypothetical protein [Ktedonobacteraceae bacterium]